MRRKQHQEGAGWISDQFNRAKDAAVQQLTDPNSFLRQNTGKLAEMAQGTKFAQIASGIDNANKKAKEMGFGRIPRAKPRWSERTRAKHAFMRALSKAGVPLSKLARAAAAAQATHERGSSMEVSMSSGMKAVGM